jgi:hypothetical protein
MEVPVAQVVVLNKIKRFAPDFHRHIVKGKIQGQVVREGDTVLVYQVAETVPAGQVQVTEQTRIEFR